jgi:hypothetical protein
MGPNPIEACYFYSCSTTFLLGALLRNQPTAPCGGLSFCH